MDSYIKCFDKSVSQEEVKKQRILAIKFFRMLQYVWNRKARNGPFEEPIDEFDAYLDPDGPLDASPLGKRMQVFFRNVYGNFKNYEGRACFTIFKYYHPAITESYKNNLKEYRVFDVEKYLDLVTNKDGTLSEDNIRSFSETSDEGNALEMSISNFHKIVNESRVLSRNF